MDSFGKEASLIEQGRAKIFEGADHLEVHGFLKEMKASDEELKKALVVLESDFVRYQLAEQERAKVLHQALGGFVVVILGVILNLYHSYDFLERYKVDYGLIIVGLWFTIRRLIKYRQPIENFIPPEIYNRPRRFKRKF